MKKNVFFMIAAILLASCGSEPAAPKRTSTAAVSYETLENKGSAMGVAQPAWITAAVQDDFGELKKDSRFNGKTPFVFNGQGENLDLTQSWVNNFIAGGAIARQISTAVNAKFEGGLQGSENSAKMQKLREVVAALSRTQISGMAREMDWWVLRRRKDTGAETYTYLVVYSISTDNLDYQIAQALGKVSAKNAEERELLSEMNSALKELEFGGIIPAQR